MKPEIGCANGLNQYASRSVPGYLDILGFAAAGTTVTVNGRATLRQGGYFYAEEPVNNAGASQFPLLTTTAAVGAASRSQTGNLFVPQTPEVFTQDADGNLVADGRWTYTWDNENRLTRLDSLAGVPDAAKAQVQFAYDAAGRRLRKQVFTWNSGCWISELHTPTR